VIKNKKSKEPRSIKPSKSSKSSNSIEVKVRVPVTRVSIMFILLIGMLTLIGYAGYLGVNSIWKFTHPQFKVSFDALKSLEYIAKDLVIPPIPGPLFIDADAPSDIAKINYLQAITEYEVEFRLQFPQSKLLNITDNELLNIGTEFCSAKRESIEQSGNYDRAKIIETFQSKFVLRYPRIEGLGIYLEAVGHRAFDELCGVN